MELESKMRMKFAELQKFYDRITGYEVKIRKLDVDSERNCEIEGRVLIPKSSFFCREQAESFETALDGVVEDLKRQLKWQKEERAEIW
jgi:putative sigma-54 modulation protein